MHHNGTGNKGAAGGSAGEGGGLPGRRFAGTAVCRDGGLPGRWFAGTVVCRGGGLPGRRFAGAVVCRDGGLPGRRFAGTAVCRDGGLPGRRFAGTAVCRDGGLPGRCGGRIAWSDGLRRKQLAEIVFRYPLPADLGKLNSGTIFPLSSAACPLFRDFSGDRGNSVPLFTLRGRENPQ